MEEGCRLNWMFLSLDTLDTAPVGQGPMLVAVKYTKDDACVKNIPRMRLQAPRPAASHCMLYSMEAKQF